MVHLRHSKRGLGWPPVFQSARWIHHKLYVCNVILATEILKYCSNSSIYASATMPQICKDHILLLIHIKCWHDVIFIDSKFPHASTKSFCSSRFVINKTPSKLLHLPHGTNVKKCNSMGAYIISPCHSIWRAILNSRTAEEAIQTGATLKFEQQPSFLGHG